MRTIQEIARQPKPSLQGLLLEYAEMFVQVEQECLSAAECARRFPGVDVDTDEEGFEAATFTGSADDAAVIVASSEFRDSHPRMNREGWTKDTDRVLHFWYSIDIISYARALKAEKAVAK